MLRSCAEPCEASVDFLLDCVSNLAVRFLLKMLCASHHRKPFGDGDFFVVCGRIVIQRCDSALNFIEREITAVYGSGNHAALEIRLVAPVQRTGGQTFEIRGAEIFCVSGGFGGLFDKIVRV